MNDLLNMNGKMYFVSYMRKHELLLFEYILIVNNKEDFNTIFVMVFISLLLKMENSSNSNI